ncbi:MAG: peptidoglycan-binding protein [Rhodobacteraceae bacterium]|nr:peptidoglycan-binding protein [Paracoccaceae bacterium]
MIRLLTTKLIAVVLLGVSALNAMAGDVALVIGNRGYHRWSPAFFAERAANAADALRRAGYTVISGGDLSIESTRRTLHLLGERLGDADRLVIVLNGHFAHSASDSWFLPVDAFTPNPISLNYEGLSLNLLLDIAAARPGRAALFLGLPAGGMATTGGIQPGIGDLDIPQGVFVARGTPVDIALTVGRDFLAPGAGLASALAAAPRSVIGSGYISDASSLSAGGPVAGGGTPEEGYWQAVLDIGNETAMRAYLNAWPNGAHVGEAQAWLDAQIVRTPEDIAREQEAALNLNREARKAIQENLTLLGYNTRGIDGVFGRGSRSAIMAWQRDQGIEVSGYLKAGQINRLDRMARAKARELADEARRKQQQMEDADRKYWVDSGAAAGSEQGLRRYLRNYPDGLYADIAELRLKAIQDDKSNRLNAQEKRVWEQVEAQDTAEAYQDYLNRYPNGAFAEDARDRLQKLEDQEERKAETAAARAEEDALRLNDFGRSLIERQLAKIGFDPGPVDGKFDRKTRKAIRQFQRGRNLPVTGFLTRDTVVRLVAEAGR